MSTLVKKLAHPIEWVPPCGCIHCGAPVYVTRDLEFREGSDIPRVFITVAVECRGCLEKEAAA